MSTPDTPNIKQVEDTTSKSTVVKNIDKIYGVFSSQEIKKVGTGTTTRKTISKIFWFVEEEDSGVISIQSINANHIPTGTKKTIEKELFLQKYSPEPEFYTQTVYPKMRELDETLNKADSSRKKGENFTAEYEYGNALAVDIANIRANFGIGLTYLERGDTEKASNIFERLINLEGAYEIEHKHLFNDFGISLRKSKMYNQAIVYYNKALELNIEDENLFLNISRVFLETKNYEECYNNILNALKLNPGNSLAIKFVDWLEVKNIITSIQATQARNIK